MFLRRASLLSSRDRQPGACGGYLPGVVDDGELGLVLELLRLLELGVVALLGAQLLHEGLICGFGEPALLVQQG